MPERIPALLSSLRVEKVLDFQEDEFVVVSLVQRTAGREGQVVVVADDDMGGVDTVYILDGHERHVVETVAAALTLPVIRIGDLQQIDIADLARRLAGIGVVEFDLVDALDLGRYGKAVYVRLLRVGAGLVSGAGAIVTLDDQRGALVQHVEIADGFTTLRQRVEPGAACPFLLGGIEFDDAKGG